MKKYITFFTGLIAFTAVSNSWALNLLNPDVYPRPNPTPIQPTPEEKSKAADIVVNQQVAKQIVRQISNVITTRVVQNINPNFNFTAPAPKKPAGAGDDDCPLMPDTFWSSFA